MSKYRDRLQIIADMLFVISGDAKKTQIMYQANLSYELLSRYLSQVLEAGLVRCESDYYKLTQKGQAFLKEFSEYLSRHETLKKQLDDDDKIRKKLEKMCFEEKNV